MPKTHLERALKRNTHRKWEKEAFAHVPGKVIATSDAMNFLAWIGAKLLEGEAIQLDGLGTIRGFFRPGRKIKSNLKHLPGDRLVRPTIKIKFKPSVTFRKRLDAAAATLTEEEAQKKFKFKGRHADVDADFKRFREGYLKSERYKARMQERALKDQARRAAQAAAEGNH